ncbi:MAG: CotH kinase family protein [Flavobacteriales bacterium]|nr:CotH kinase family protein [Flavobacteriales bacterium]
MEVKKKKFIFISTAIVVLMASLIALLHFFGPGEKYLTKRGADWQKKVLEDGKTIEFSTDFFVDDPEKLSDIFLWAPGSQVLQLLINHRVVMDLNPYAYYPSDVNGTSISFDEYHKPQPHFIGDTKMKQALKKGYNSIRIWTTSEGLGGWQHNDWRLIANYSGLSFRYGNSQKEVPFEWTPDNDRPVVYIDVDENIIPDNPRVSGALTLKSEGELLFYSSVELETRGRSSQVISKKQFNVRLVDVKNHDPIYESIDGMAPAADWILYGPYMDLSLIRNSLAFSIYSQMGHYAPKTKLVDLVINNNYRGAYVLTEKIQALPGRLKITMYPTDTLNPRNNGFLVQVNPSNEKDKVFFIRTASFVLEKPHVNYKESKLYESYVAGQLNIMLDPVMIAGENYDYTIDFKSFADFFLINELSKNIDAYRLSAYFHKTHEDEDALIKAGPIWDFNIAFGVDDETGGANPEGWIYQKSDATDSLWHRLNKNREFSQFLKSRYAELRKDVFSETNIISLIDSLVSDIEPYIEDNRRRYGWPSKDFWPYIKLPVDYNTEINNMKSFLRKRLLWMDEQFQR